MKRFLSWLLELCEEEHSLQNAIVKVVGLAWCFGEVGPLQNGAFITIAYCLLFYLVFRIPCGVEFFNEYAAAEKAKMVLVFYLGAIFLFIFISILFPFHDEVFLSIFCETSK
ncbi:hypothetical protein [Pseudodesulfovibrio tunisiensis]|uniref:hypothetical protein n=1 Tax=Pseudodesulfovibrio tunisiensis TaxID=463192 RepID=UPI001FB3126E|nr:hypothetical protein [Pseudodesulfovibrio tunisiensis]